MFDCIQKWIAGFGLSDSHALLLLTADSVHLSFCPRQIYELWSANAHILLFLLLAGCVAQCCVLPRLSGKTVISRQSRCPCSVMMLVL